ncbi:hypothetical protein [Bacterioplanoides sp.]|uniref:hypothetical protein n=1 Tax=Bacterioplanoides sp. TaxID=2066072 RepID=UPI003B00B939
MNSYDSRQIKKMQDKLRLYDIGSVGLGDLVGNLIFLRNSLEVCLDDWDREFTDRLTDLESANSYMIEKGHAIPDDVIQPIVESGIFEIREIIKYLARVELSNNESIKHIINEELGVLYYDGESMGGGTISFSCDNCSELIEKETLGFTIEAMKLNASVKQRIEGYFDIDANVYKYSELCIGFMQCDYCNCSHIACISNGEIQNGRYQSKIFGVVRELY